LPIRFFQPIRELADVVTRIYAHDTGLASPGDESSWLIVPDGEIKVIFPVRGDITCAIGDRVRLHRAGRLIVSTMRTAPGHLSFPGGVDAIGVIVRPEAAYRLFDVPHYELANLTLDGEEVIGAAARLWHEELASLSALEDRVSVLQKRLWGWLRRRERRDRAYEFAVRRVRHAEGSIVIEDVALQLGWSRRHLERRFREYVGVGPKTFATILRFHAAYKRLRNAGPSRYADAIGDAYFDQSHFLKEFKRFTGTTPGAYTRAADYGSLYIPD
jgi:AraC-like DNA-binding protein